MIQDAPWKAFFDAIYSVSGHFGDLERPPESIFVALYVGFRLTLVM